MKKEIFDLKDIETWLEVKIGINNQIIDFEKFISNLESLGSIHIRKKWLPATCTGLEIWLIVKWGLGIWFSGKLYDVMKVYERKLLKYLESLFSVNHEDMELKTLSIEYDDTTITFNSINNHVLVRLSSFFNNLQKNLRILESKGVQNIDKISIPIFGDELENVCKKDNKINDYDSWGKDYFKIWSITYDFGLSKVLYDSEKEDIIYRIL